jgi:hypothetical protein
MTARPESAALEPKGCRAPAARRHVPAQDAAATHPAGMDRLRPLGPSISAERCAPEVLPDEQGLRGGCVVLDDGYRRRGVGDEAVMRAD